jgi:hypothetical protein
MRGTTWLKFEIGEISRMHEVTPPIYLPHSSHSKFECCDMQGVMQEEAASSSLPIGTHTSTW